MACEKGEEDFQPHPPYAEATAVYPSRSAIDEALVMLEPPGAGTPDPERYLQPDAWPPTGTPAPVEAYLPHPDLPSRFIPVRIYRQLPTAARPRPLLPTTTTPPACPFGKCYRQLRAAIVDYQARADRYCRSYEACIACCDPDGQPVYFMLSIRPRCRNNRVVQAAVLKAD